MCACATSCLHRICVSCTSTRTVRVCHLCGSASCPPILRLRYCPHRRCDAESARCVLLLRSPQCIIVFVSSPLLRTPPPALLLLLVVSRSIIRIRTVRVALTLVPMHAYDSTRPPTLAAILSTLLVAHAPSSAFYIFVHVLYMYYLRIITTQNTNLFIS